MTMRSLVFLAMAVAACDRGRIRLTTAEEQTIDRWLLCEECTEGELDSVVALRSRAVNRLGEALEGPPDDRLANKRMQIEAMYARTPTPAGGIDSQRYVQHYVGNYIATYQSRAATALAAIGTPEAQQLLRDALSNDSLYRPDVRRVLGRAVGAALSVVAGDSQPAPFGQLVKVNPEILLADTGGQGLRDVRVVFRVDSGGGEVVSDSVQRTDVNGRASVSWRLGGPPSDTINLLRAVAAGRHVHVRATAHPPGPRVVFVVQPSDGKAGQPLAPPAKIEVQDAFGTLQTSFNQSATATVDGTAIDALFNIVNGEGTFPALIVPAPKALTRLRVTSIGLPVAFSARFNVTP